MINLAWRGEHGQVGEIFNMDPLPWFLPRFLNKLKTLNREPQLSILVGNQNIFMWKWLLVYIAYFILYREYGKLGELFNMDPLPWLLPRFLYKLKSLNREPHLFHPCGKSKYIHAQMIIGLHYILHLV